MFLQTLQNAAITRLHCQTESLHIFDAGKLVSLSFPPAYQPLSDDLLTGCIQSLETLYRATPPIFTSQRIGAVPLDFGLALHLCDFPGTPVMGDGQSTKSGRT